MNPIDIQLLNQQLFAPQFSDSAQKDGKGKAEVFANAIKHEPKEQREQSGTCSDSAESRLRKSKAQFRSKNPTTRWTDII
jgi:hypothetical protein